MGGLRGLRLEPTGSSYPNVIGGGPSDLASNGVTGVFVGGGAYNTAEFFSAVAGGDLNKASGLYSVVGGRFINTASGDYSFVGGGSDTSDVSNTL